METKQRTKCASESCHNDVFHDKELPGGMPKFMYCSPPCRDKCLLERNCTETKSEILVLEMSLDSIKGDLHRQGTGGGSTCRFCPAGSKAVAAVSRKNSSSLGIASNSRPIVGKLIDINSNTMIYPAILSFVLTPCVCVCQVIL